jgi:hypothetical protein
VEASPFTGEEILKLDAFCRERYVELVPNQNSFGHFNRWLKHPHYLPLAEAPDGFDFPWAHHTGPFSLCPLNPESIKLIAGLYNELLPHFSSRQINVGCDETFDLGQGLSRDLCEKVGIGRVYHDFLMKIYQEVINHGCIMQFWGDMILKYPNLFPELPKDCIALEWGYEFNHPFDEQCEEFAHSDVHFYVCPGTSSWNSIAGRTDNCLQNLANAAISGQKFGAIGYLITDWGDNGHWQVLPVSYLGFAAGSAYSWSVQSNHDLDIVAALDFYAFQDLSHLLGRITYNLGNVYKEFGVNIENCSVLFEILQKPIVHWINCLPGEEATNILKNLVEIIENEGNNISRCNSTRTDNELLQREFRLTNDLLKHACMRGLFGYGSQNVSKKYLRQNLQKIITEYQEIWLLRNRPGGLQDSLSYFNLPLREYE